MWWFLTREVLRLRGEINRQAPWDVMVDLYFFRDPEEVKSKLKYFIFIMKTILFLKTEKEDQVAVTGQDRDGQARGVDSNYYDDGPSIMPSSENFAGNQDNWGASAADNWGVAGAGTSAGAGTGGAETNDWNASNAANTGVTSHW